MFARLRFYSGLTLLMAAFIVPLRGQNYITTATTGAESKLDNSPQSVTFNLTVTGSGVYSLAGGIIYMKAGTTATETVTLSAYLGNSLVSGGSITLTNQQFCSGIRNCQNYAYHTFTFPSPLNLVPGSYTLVLTSSANPQQNQAYFAKSAGTSFSVSGITPAVPDLVVSKTADPVNFIAGSEAIYTVQVSNVGNAATSGQITVTDTLDSNLTYVSATGANWNCGIGTAVTCTTTASIGSGTSSFIAITVAVANNREVSVTNNVTV